MEIKTIEQLILALNTCAIDKTESCHLNVIKNIQIPLKVWEKHFVFKEGQPGIVSLYSDKKYQLILSCWEKGQQGPIHDIDPEEAWIHPICGQFIEERYRVSTSKKELEQVSSILLNTQSYSYMQKSKTIYRYVNSYENRSVCLHLYSEPVVERREYDQKTGQGKLVKQLFDRYAHEYEHLNNFLLDTIQITASKSINIKKLHPVAKKVSTVTLFNGKEGVTQSIHVTKGAEISKHQSESPALLICVSGEVIFQNENGVEVTFKSGNYIRIEPEVEHWIHAALDSYLLLIK